MKNAPHLRVVARSSSIERFNTARQEMLRCWRDAVNDGHSLADLGDEVTGTQAAMTKIVGLLRG